MWDVFPPRTKLPGINFAEFAVNLCPAPADPLHTVTIIFLLVDGIVSSKSCVHRVCNDRCLEDTLCCTAQKSVGVNMTNRITRLEKVTQGYGNRGCDHYTRRLIILSCMGTSLKNAICYQNGDDDGPGVIPLLFDCANET